MESEIKWSPGTDVTENHKRKHWTSRGRNPSRRPALQYISMKHLWWDDTSCHFFFFFLSFNSTWRAGACDTCPAVLSSASLSEAGWFSQFTYFRKLYSYKINTGAVRRVCTLKYTGWQSVDVVSQRQRRSDSVSLKMRNLQNIKDSGIIVKVTLMEHVDL